MRSCMLERVGLSLRVLLHGGEPRRWPSRRQLVRGFRNLRRVLGSAALFMPPSEGQELRALTVAAQAIEGRKCAVTAKVHPDARIVYNHAHGDLAREARRFPLTGGTTPPTQARILTQNFFSVIVGKLSDIKTVNKPFVWNYRHYAVTLLAMLLIAPCVFAASGCDNLSGTPIHTQVNWQSQVKPIINDMLGGYCTSCHSGGSPAGGLDLSDSFGLDVLYRIVGDVVLPGDPAGSKLFIKINCAIPDTGIRMPPGGSLTIANQELIYDWIEQGAYGENPAKPIYRDFIFRDGAESIRIMK